MSETEFPILSMKQSEILEHLAERWPIALAQVDIAVAVDVESRATVRKHLKQLAGIGLVESSKQHRGYFATLLGRELAQYLRAKIDRKLTTRQKPTR